MSVPASFLGAADAAELAAVERDGFATALAFARASGRTVNLVLHRDSEQDGTSAAKPPQEVLVEYADRQPQRPGEGGPYALTYDGTFSRFAPFDVAAGDRFKLPDGTFGRIAAPISEENGIVRARFTLEVG